MFFCYIIFPQKRFVLYFCTYSKHLHFTEKGFQHPLMHRTTETHPRERQVTIETDSTYAADAAKPPPIGKHHNKHSVCYNIVCIKCLCGFINLFMSSIGLQHELKEQALVVLGTDNKEQMVASVVRLSTQSRDGTVTVRERC